jgi:hypothetical protein
MKLVHTTFESFPCVYNDREGYVLFVAEEGWREMPLAEIQHTARWPGMTEEEFKRRYAEAPPCPIG